MSLNKLVVLERLKSYWQQGTSCKALWLYLKLVLVVIVLHFVFIAAGLFLQALLVLVAVTTIVLMVTLVLITLTLLSQWWRWLRDWQLVRKQWVCVVGMGFVTYGLWIYPPVFSAEAANFHEGLAHVGIITPQYLLGLARCPSGAHKFGECFEQNE